MSEEVKAIELTEEQNKILREVFQYQDEYELSEADLELATVMFDTPEKFKLLRKILNIHTKDEMGITFKNPHTLIESSLANKEAYAVETAVSQLADERIRQALVGMYVTLRRHLQSKKKDQFDEANKAEFEESQRTEEYDEKQEEEKRELGEQL